MGYWTIDETRLPHIVDTPITHISQLSFRTARSWRRLVSCVDVGQLVVPESQDWGTMGQR